MKHAKEAFPELLFSFEQGYKPGIRIRVRGSLGFRAVKTGGGRRADQPACLEPERKAVL